MDRRQLPTRIAVSAGLGICIAGLGAIDYYTGYELNFFVFYFIPVGIAAYALGVVPALGVSVLCAITWAIAEDQSGHTYSSHFLAVWNTMIRLAAFVAIGVAVARIKSLLDRQTEIAQRLEKSLAELKILEGILPMCAWCKRIKESDGQWQQLEAYIAEHSSAQFSHGICPTCKDRMLRDAGFGGSQSVPKAPASREP